MKLAFIGLCYYFPYQKYRSMVIKRMRYGFCFLFLIVACANNLWAQGFLEMPDTSEVPEYERESMLLDLDVPAVRDRDPDPDAGPRLNVREFRLQGLVEFPELNITREELIKRVEAIRFDLMQEGEKTDSGYTLDELGEISDLMADIEHQAKDQHVGPLEVQKLVFLIRDQRRRRGVTLGMIETVADTITRYYRERGFILAKAYIPKQKVRDGIVTLTLLLGELGEVAVENKKRVREKLITRVFSKDLNKPVTSWNIEESLYLINDIPGLSAQGFFSPGSQVGDTKLNVNVLDEKWFSTNIKLDNYGSENTSENRIYADFYLHNPLGIGDQLYLAILNSYDPDSSTYGAFRYSSFLFNPRFRASVGFSTNDFSSRTVRGAIATQFTGESEVSDLSLTYTFKRSRVKNFSTEIKYMDIASELDTGATSTSDEVKKLSVGFNFDLLNQKRRHLYVGSISLAYADTFQVGAFGVSGDGSDTDVMLMYDVSMLSFPKIPFTKNETRLLLKSSGQYAGKDLSNLNQISLTGPTRTRGFVVNGLQTDDGIYLGVDWIFNLPKFGGFKIFGEPLNRIFNPYIYADAAYGILHPLDNGNKINGQLSNVGIGLKFKHSNFGGSLSAASVITDEVSDLQEETPRKGVYFDIQYSF